MNNNDANQYNQEDEISLKELIMTLYNNWKLIFAITLACALLSLIYSFFIASPEYKASSEALISAPISVDTRYGTYAFSSANVADYANYLRSDEVLTRVIQKLGLKDNVDSLRERLTSKTEIESSRFLLTASGETRKAAKILNDAVVDQFNETLRITMKKQALEHFIGFYEEQIVSLVNIISQKEAIIAKTKTLLDSLEPIYTLQKALFSSPESAAVYAKKFGLDLSTLSENVMVEEFANENYFKVEEQYTNMQIELISLNQTLNKSNDFLIDLKLEKEDFNSKYQTVDESKILNNKLDVYAHQFVVTSYAIEPEFPVGPKKALNLAIGLVLGLMLGTFAAFMKAYWERG